MFHRTRHDKIPVPIERHTGGVHMPVTGHVRHSIGNAAGNEAKLNGTPGVAARVHTLYLIESDDVGVRQLVQNAVHHGRLVACRDQRAFAGPVRSDLVKLYNTSGDHRDALGNRCGHAQRIRQSPGQHVGTVREVFHRSWLDSTTLNATMTLTRKPVNVTRCCRTSSNPNASAITPTTARSSGDRNSTPVSLSNGQETGSATGVAAVGDDGGLADERGASAAASAKVGMPCPSSCFRPRMTRRWIQLRVPVRWT